MEKLTIEEVNKRIDWIKNNLYDDEACHSKEDQLREMFIVNVINKQYTIEEAAEIGRLVMSTDDLDFQRWCA
jgi:hypothetical protein